MSKNIYSILYLHSSSELYGSDTSLINIIKYSSKVHRCIVVIPSSGPLVKHLEEHENVIIYKHNCGILRKKNLNFFGLLRYAYHLFSGIIFLIFLIKREGINLVHTNTSAIVTGAIVSRLLGNKHIWHVREIIYRPRLFAKCLNTMIILFSTEIIAISQSVKENLLFNSYVNNSKKIRVLLNGIDCQKSKRNVNIRNKLLKRYNIKESELVVGMVGRIHYWKGQNILIKAAKIVVNENINTKFFIVGDTFKGYENLLLNLKDMVRQLNLEKNVFFTGFIEDKSNFYNLFDVFVHASTSPEPFGLVILEAMANGLPVIAPDLGGPKEIIKDEVSGLLVPPGNPEKLATSILYLLKNEELRKTLGNAAYNEVSLHYSINKSIEQIMSLYNKLLKE